MKINPYLTVIQGQRPNQSKRTERSKPDSAFDAALSSASSVTEESRAFEVVSLENRRAVAAAPPKDMAEAEAVLARATEQLGDMSRGQLRSVHSLEGLVHFYSA